MTAPFFSVLVPTYNHAKYIGLALESLLAQTDPDWEAVVVNDGSTDNTPKLLERYADRDPRIRVFHKSNGGTGSALNFALSKARGQWVGWLSSDDLFDPTKLALHRQWIAREPASQFFFTYCRLLFEQSGKTTNQELWCPLPAREFQILGLFNRNYVSGISICVNRKAMESTGNFKENLRYAQDYDMWLRLLSRNPATFIPEWTCTNRIHGRQGSALFERACYYDSATAAIEFINEHSFEELFPLLDLRDGATALRAVEQALIRASDESGFLYWLGAHPALLLRTLAWVWDRSPGSPPSQERAPLREAARQILADTARKLRDTPLGWFWHVASAAAEVDDVEFVYSAVHAMDVSRGFLSDLRVRKSNETADVERYFKMQYGLEPPAAPNQLASRTVVLCGKNEATSNSAGSIELPADQAAWTDALQEAGCKVVVLNGGPNRCRDVDNTPVIETRTPRTQEAVLRSLLPIEAVIWLDAPPKSLALYPAKQQHVVTDPVQEKSIIVQRIVDGVADARRPVRSAPSRQPADRKKIVFIGYGCTPATGGGAPRVIYDLLNGLDPQKFELHFVDLKLSNEPSLELDSAVRVHEVQREEWGRLLRVPIWKRALRRGLRLLAPWTRTTEIAQHFDPLVNSIQETWPYVVVLREILQRIGSDALLVPVLEENAVRVWLAQAFCPQPYCVSLHISESHYFPVIFPNENRLAMERFLFANACRNAALVTLPSEGCKEDLVKHFGVPESIVEVASNPIDVENVMRASVEAPEIPLPALHQKCLFIHAARLCAQKNHLLLLEACRLLKQTHPDFLVVCLGEGGLRRDLEKQIHEMGLDEHVLLLGAVKNPFAYMARAQGLLLTSDFEAFALVLVEALACGAVPVSVDCPHGPREVLDNGKHGLLVPMNDPQRFANAMHRVMVDPQLREFTRTQGPKRARDYDVAKVVAQWEERFERILTCPLQAQKSECAA